MDGFRYVSKRNDLITILLMYFIIGTFGLNFPIYISTMAVSVFHVGASSTDCLRRLWQLVRSQALFYPPGENSLV